VLSILEKSCEGYWRLADHARYLEKNEKGTIAFSMGSIFCSYATREFHATNGDQLIRFWHFQVASHPGVNLCGVGQPQARQVENPDFLAEDDKGDWYLVEAKGTLSARSDSELRDGLKQARKYQGIVFVEPATGQLASHVVAGSACISTYFDENGSSLQVTHLDPPNGTLSGAAEFPLVIVREAADLFRFHEAAMSFTIFGEGRDEFEMGAIWRSARTLGEISIGISRLHWDLRDCLAWTVKALTVVTPLIRNARAAESSGPEGRALLSDPSLILENEIVRAAPDGTEEAEAWRELARILSSFEAGDSGSIWQQALSHFWLAPTLLPFKNRPMTGGVRSIGDLWSYLWEANAAMREQVRLRNRLGSGRLNEVVDTTTGLLLAAVK
jgi:hypothetical protein